MCVCVHFYLFFAFVLNVQFYTYLLSHEERRTESWTLEQYPRKSLKTLQKVLPPLMLHRDLQSIRKIHSSLLSRCSLLHKISTFQINFRSMQRSTCRAITNRFPPPPGSHSDNFSPISVIFSGKGNKKRKEEEWNTRSIPKWQIRKDSFPQNLIDSSFVKLLQNSRDSTIFE